MVSDLAKLFFKVPEPFVNMDVQVKFIPYAGGIRANIDGAIGVRAVMVASGKPNAKE